MSARNRRLLLLLYFAAALAVPQVHCLTINATQAQNFCTESTFFSVADFVALNASLNFTEDFIALSASLNFTENLCQSCDSLCIDCFGPAPSQCYACTDGSRMLAPGSETGSVEVINDTFIVDTTRDVLMCEPVGDSDSFPLGGIIGAAVGGGVLLLVVLLCLCGCVCLCRRKSKSKTEVFHRIDDERGNETLPTRSVFTPIKDVPDSGLTSSPLDLTQTPDSDNPLYMHSFESVGTPLQKSSSSERVRESGFPDTMEGVSASPGGQSYIKMNPADTRPPGKSYSAENLVENQGAGKSTFLTPAASEGELVGPGRPQALSDPTRRWDIPATPPLSPRLANTSPRPKSPRPSSPFVQTSAYPSSPNHRPPTSPRPKSPRPPPPSPRPKPSPRRQPSPRHPSPLHHPSPARSTPATPPPTPTVQPREEEDRGGVDEYVDPQVFQEDLEKAAQSYVNKEAIQEHTGMSRENSLSNLTDLEDKPEPSYDYVPHERGFRYSQKDTGDAQAHEEELVDERQDDYETVQEFLGQDQSSEGGEEGGGNYYNIPELLEDVSEERYENVREERGYLPDDYQSVSDIQNEQLLGAEGTPQLEESETMRLQRVPSVDNQYVDMKPHRGKVKQLMDSAQAKIRTVSEPSSNPLAYESLSGPLSDAPKEERGVSEPATVQVLSAEKKRKGKQTRMAELFFHNPDKSEGRQESVTSSDAVPVVQNGVLGGRRPAAEETLPLYENVAKAGVDIREGEQDIGGEELYQNIN